MPVVLSDVQFHRATIMPKDGSVKFLVNIFEGSGEFEICEGGSVAVSGKIAVPEDITKEMINLPDQTPIPESEDILNLNTSDVYKELRLRGYDYEGIFRGIVDADNRAVTGSLAWNSNWISFIDTMLQFSIIGTSTRELYLPTRLQKAIINPKEHLAQVAALTEGGGVPVQMHRAVGIIKSGGVELRGMKASLAPRRQQTQAAPKLEKYQFVPLQNTAPLNEDFEKAKYQALTAAVQVVLENSSGAMKIKVVEVAGERPVESVLATIVKDALELEPMVACDYTIVTTGNPESYTTALESRAVKVVQKDVTKGAFEQNAHLVIVPDCLTLKQTAIVENAAACLKAGGFVLVEEPKGPIDSKAVVALGLSVVSIQNAGTKTYALLRKPVDLPTESLVINVTENNFNWVEPLKEAMKQSEKDATRIFLVCQGEELTGLVGLTNCVKQEPGGVNVRSFFLQDAKAEKFSVKSPLYSEQIKKDLVHNVMKNSTWGTFRHILLEQVAESGKLQVEHAYINTITRGDLASLKWIEGPLGYHKYDAL